MSIVPINEHRPPLQAGASVAAIVPQTMDEVFRLAKAVCAAGWAPKGMDRPESCAVAIMHGLEIGLKPLTALQRIAVVNGRPTLWGDGAMSLVRASGLCSGVDETITGTGDARTATCSAHRKGEAKAIVRTFSVADAKKAGLWGKSGPWSQYPDRMLQMRARAFALRDGFADVLGGFYMREEIEEDDDKRAARARPTRVETVETVDATTGEVTQALPADTGPTSDDIEDAAIKLETAASRGMDALSAEWAATPKAIQRIVKPRLDKDWKPAARQADQDGAEAAEAAAADMESANG